MKCIYSLHADTWDDTSIHPWIKTSTNQEAAGSYYDGRQLISVHQKQRFFRCFPVVCVCRCLELHPNNLQALMALAVSLTNTGMRQDACEALLGWIRHNPKYKHLLKSRTHLQGSPGSRKLSYSSSNGWYGFKWMQEYTAAPILVWILNLHLMYEFHYCRNKILTDKWF